MDVSASIPANIEVLMDVPVKLTVELGSCLMPMRDVLQLTAGAVVQLDKVADTPVDLFINQKRIARGEVVVVEDRFGIKITEIFGSVAPPEPK
ncbi:MAG: flagellar motor switch protein FliN [Verrucomicrobiales bacterium]|nr:flagellar motor switch protein FliN [Verrucomicrobiales bacterium]